MSLDGQIGSHHVLCWTLVEAGVYFSPMIVPIAILLKTFDKGSK